MAPPEPSKNFEQNSPITTILRQICESYPESSCLRELLQNADDAQASEIEYTLDTKTYDDLPLIHPGLQAYHGPALLVKNNQVFTDSDFASLASIGDSRKRDDPTSTGKYGQGFNSCFHWTDGPWILSRQWLLFLDPHREWSSDRGGPTYDILNYQDSVELQNHLKTFQRAKIDTSQAVNATIIRIPLRTVAQAERSKIVNRQATVEEITKALYDLGHEIREGGMLFLRHVRRVAAQIDGTILWEARNTGVTDEDAKAMSNISTTFRQMYAGSSSAGQGKDFATSFHVNINYCEGETQSVRKFLLQHLMSRSSGDAALDTWARQRKLFPWAAVAAPLDHELSTGRLFACLKLPIETGQPVHVHGLFSIVPDRGRLSSSGQTSKDSGSEWNGFMFRRCVVTAWTDLLTARNTVAWKQDLYKLWPHLNLSQSVELWSSLDDHVLDRIITRRLPVWNTPKDCVALEKGFFVPDSEVARAYSNAFQAIHLPLVCLEERMYQKLLQRASELAVDIQILTPEALRLFLRKNHQSQQIYNYTPLLLQYCLQDFIDGATSVEKPLQLREEFRGIRLWPTLHNSLALLKDETFLLPRGKEELTLFSSSRQSDTLDLQYLTPRVLALLESYAAKAPYLVRHRTISDLEVDWPQLYKVESPDEDVDDHTRDTKDDELIRRMWAWICARSEGAGKPSLLSIHHLDSLFLMPLKGSRIRKVISSRTGSPTLILESAADWMHELLDDRNSSRTCSANFVLDTDVLPIPAIELLSSAAPERADLDLAISSDLKSLLAWLAGNTGFVCELSSLQKEILTRQLDLLTWQQGRLLRPEAKHTLKQQMLQLPIFSQITATAPYRVISTERVSIGTSNRAIRTIEGCPPIPAVPGLAFFEPLDTHETHLLEFFGLLEKIPLEDLFFDILIPNVEKANDRNLAEVKLRLVEFVLDKTLRPSDRFKSRFAQCELLPRSVRHSNQGIQFRSLATTVDPKSTISSLFYGDEDVFPETGFLQRHYEMLKSCGIIRVLTPAILMERAQTFASCSRDKRQLLVKVKDLLRMPLYANFSLSPASLKQLRALKWLPVQGSPDRGLQMVSPENCRAVDDEELVDLVLGSFETSVTPEWKALLGWDQAIGQHILMEQLQKSLALRSSHRVDKVLAYLGKVGDCNFLRQTPCILANHGEYLLPERVIRPGSLLSRYPLAPYLDEVESSFARKHATLLTALGIRQDVTYDDVLSVQSMIVEASQPGSLSSDQLNVVFSLLEISTRLPGDNNNLSLLKIPDTEGKLHFRSDIVCGDGNVNGKIASFNFVNRKVSPDLVERLQLENSFARATRLGIEFEDEDEDEYTPREKLTTTISDTLGRYSIDSTFSEFLANANDCGATQISWILDTCVRGPYQSTALLSEELMALQGFALFVYNNRVFSENDFRGFKEIGRGGKTSDETSTGMFGRGAMTMYHFTDVPMLISGSSFLILDPQRRFLPLNKHWQHKVGVKVSLATARQRFPDQLRPFHGLQGYSMDSDTYDGTLFRLPLRSMEQTLLKENSALIDVNETQALLEDYYATAQMSLLFLRNVHTIDFRVRGQEASWTVTATPLGSSVDDVFRDINITSCYRSKANNIAVYRIGMTDIEEAPKHLVNSGRRASKVTECGLAACLSVEGNATKGIPNQVFCTLPTGLVTQLPVSIHASFAITGDRKTIPFEETKSNVAITAWNRWLLTTCIPGFYLDFLKDLAPRIGEQAFDFWPLTAGVASNQSLDKIILDAFWDQLTSKQYESYQLFPLAEKIDAIEHSTSLKTRTVGRVRKLFKVTCLRSAQFNVLQGRVCARLSPLFSNICPNLVRPPRRLWKDMTAFKVDQTLTVLKSEYLCDLFRIEANCIVLEAFLEGCYSEADRDEAMEMLLFIVVPTRSSDSCRPLDMVSGCRIIPKLNQTLGTVKFQSGDMTTWSRPDILFLPTVAEAELFAHSADSLIKPSLFREASPEHTSVIPKLGTLTQASRNPLLDMMTESSNLRQIGLSDIESFLTHVESTSASTVGNKELDSWIVKFWSYLNSRLPIHIGKGDSMAGCVSIWNQLKDLRLYDTPIIRYQKDNTWHYITPQQFEEGPYIIAPSEQNERYMCMLFPSIKAIDPICVPSQLHFIESRLEGSQAFDRLLRAITMTGASKMRCGSIENPEYKCLQLLRDLIRKHESSQIVVQHQKVLRALPIWPQLGPHEPSENGRCISAQDALLCAHRAMLLPYIRERDRFVNPELVKTYSSTLRLLGCTLMDIESIWNHLEPSLPQKLMPDQLEAYLDSIECLARHDWKPCSKIAPNGDGTLCSPSSLYDHKDDIFLAAFGKSPKSYFLHPDVWGKRDYWINLGLGARSNSGSMSDSRFLQCITRIEARLVCGSATDQDKQDAAKVSGYLCFYHPGLESWPASSWASIRRARIYQANADVSSEPAYRQAQMRLIANKVGPYSIQYAASKAHIRVVWSQRPLLKDPPNALVYKHVGPPLPMSVYDHLHFLIKIRNTVSSQELSEYLKDLQATYSVLQDWPGTASIPNIRDDKIWLNLPTTDLTSISPSQLDGALRSAKSLCLKAPLDTHVMERAKNFLIPYESLLCKLGCKAISQPARSKSVPRSNDIRMIDKSLTVIRSMRKEQNLVDVVFEAEGLQISAHKIFLAAASDYCRIQFLGDWGRLLGLKPTICIEDLTAKTLQYIVDFAYTGEVTWPILDNAEDFDEVADKLDELLDLLRGADMWLMEALHDLTERHLLENSETYVRPDNVDSVKELAEVARAKHLVKHCEEFILNNAEFVQDCRDMK
ncbi:MAG: hypothetical protein Q9182_003658 [Xanthomendoza sp. 2 TL-2023]